MYDTVFCHCYRNRIIEYSGTDVSLLIQDFVPYNFFKIKITSILETTVGVPG